MSAEIAALINQPAMLIAAFTLGGVAGMAVGMLIEQVLSDRQRAARRAFWAAKRQYQHKLNGIGAWTGPRRGRPDAADQLRIVEGAAFTAKRLLNRKEARLFRELDRMVIGLNPAWQVMAQVSLGEILTSRDEEAFFCINAKRVDLLLVDADCRPRHAVEYQGGGHYRHEAAARDAVKREALRRAGIGYHEIIAGRTTPSELKQLVGKLVDPPEPARRIERAPKPEASPSAATSHPHHGRGEGGQPVVPQT